MEWMIWCPDDGDEGPNDGRKVIADTPREAVEMWAQRKDQSSAEYSIARGNAVEVVVSPSVPTSESKDLRYTVSGEAVPSYYAQLLTPNAVGKPTPD